MLRLTIVMLLLPALLFTSCKKDGCTAGAGGGLTFVLRPKHHIRPIPGCTIKLRYNTKTFPGADGAYDIVTTALENETSVTINGLRCGEYYIFGSGIDTTLSEDNNLVKGGIPFSIEQESGTVYIDVPVTEVH